MQALSCHVSVQVGADLQHVLLSCEHFCTVVDQLYLYIVSGGRRWRQNLLAMDLIVVGILMETIC